MLKYTYAAAFALIANPALARHYNDVPEMSAGAGIAAIALLAGVATVIRQRSKRK